MTTDAARAWIGRTTLRPDTVSTRLIEAFKATLHPHLWPAPVPLGLFWCLAPETVAGDQLGGDGHPQLGLSLPDLGFERRMWAGGEIALHAPLRPGEAITKESRIADIAFKEGRTGSLCFVTVTHAYRGEREGEATVLVSERQDIVYRNAGAGGPARPPAALETPLARITVTPTPTLLFRYSAITFNGHRIHYDAPYARDVEGYDDLVVHGPLQATLMLNLLAAHLEGSPARFAYRGVSPLTLGSPFFVEVIAQEGGLGARVVAGDGALAFMGTAFAAPGDAR